MAVCASLKECGDVKVNALNTKSVKQSGPNNVSITCNLPLKVEAVFAGFRVRRPALTPLLPPLSVVAVQLWEEPIVYSR